MFLDRSLVANWWTCKGFLVKTQHSMIVTVNNHEHQWINRFDKNEYTWKIGKKYALKKNFKRTISKTSFMSVGKRAQHRLSVPKGTSSIQCAIEFLIVLTNTCISKVGICIWWMKCLYEYKPCAITQFCISLIGQSCIIPAGHTTCTMSMLCSWSWPHSGQKAFWSVLTFYTFTWHAALELLANFIATSVSMLNNSVTWKNYTMFYVNVFFMFCMFKIQYVGWTWMHNWISINEKSIW